MLSEEAAKDSNIYSETDNKNVILNIPSLDKLNKKYNAISVNRPRIYNSKNHKDLSQKKIDRINKFRRLIKERGLDRVISITFDTAVVLSTIIDDYSNNQTIEYAKNSALAHAFLNDKTNVSSKSNNSISGCIDIQYSVTSINPITGEIEHKQNTSPKSIILNSEDTNSDQAVFPITLLKDGEIVTTGYTSSNYEFNNLEPGSYTVKINYSEFIATESVTIELTELNHPIYDFEFPPSKTSDEKIAIISELYPRPNGDVENVLLGDIFVYPNPFSFLEGGGISYRLSTDMEIQLKIYGLYQAF